MSRRNKLDLDTDPKSIQLIELLGQSKKLDVDHGAESVFISTIKKIKEMRLKFSQGSVTIMKDNKLLRSKS